MTRRTWVIALLLWLYPAAWRRQYGGELRDVLERTPLTFATAVDVVHAAAWQHLRSLTPGTILGLACIVLFLAGVVLTPTGYASGGTALVRPSNITFPSIKVTLFESEIFAILLMACGCWTQLRRGRGTARAAAWMTVVAGLPISMLGLAMWLGLATVQMTPAGVSDHSVTPYALNMMIAPLLRAPESAIWGLVGGGIGRWLSRRRPAHA